MSERAAFEGLKTVVERMVTDDEFKKAILENPEEALSAGGYEVSAEELLALKNLKVEDLEGLTPELIDERLSKSIGIYELTIYTDNIKS